MAIEIERKFLLQNDTWRSHVHRSTRIRDGLIFTEDGRKLRVRREDEAATLTYKGPRNGYSREEFEFLIDVEDAERLLSHHCTQRVIEKTRHYTEHANNNWVVDEYEALLKGQILAEIELSHPNQDFERPPWLGEEVTGHAEYRKINMLKNALEKFEMLIKE